MSDLIPSQIPKRITSTVIIVIIVVIIALGGLYYYYQEKEEKVTQPSSEETSSEKPEVTTPKILYSLTGVIERFEESAIYFEADITQIDKKGQLTSKKEIRKAILGPVTEINRLDFIIHQETGKKIPKETKIDFEDLKVGNRIVVLSSQNISELGEFMVTKIRVLSY